MTRAAKAAGCLSTTPGSRGGLDARRMLDENVNATFCRVVRRGRCGKNGGTPSCIVTKVLTGKHAKMARARIDIPRERIIAFCRRHHIRKLAFFGSVLREDFRSNSDVDVLVEFEW